jgi:hypothetical protein
MKIKFNSKKHKQKVLKKKVQKIRKAKKRTHDGGEASPPPSPPLPV